MIGDIWASYRSLPGWVQIWVAFILVPVNMASLVVVGEPGGWWIAGLAIGGMAPNAVLIFVERGFSKAMSISHVILWVPLVVILGLRIDEGLTPLLWAILIVDVISLGFDFKDSWQWWNGDRAVTGK